MGKGFCALRGKKTGIFVVLRDFLRGRAVKAAARGGALPCPFESRCTSPRVKKAGQRVRRPPSRSFHSSSSTASASRGVLNTEAEKRRVPVSEVPAVR